ncbi:alpha/beta hydrolase family esterase [Radiobacillus sp. PE A8.2]|uniref:alpha/beta hydrolase family esterase n=1 Tax=Radiobacillus sp. PE A8.2 TaxID=3380349 RepID=UPI0038909EF1
MNEKIFIKPGTPNDGNREYLPEAIQGSNMVVNENGNNSQVYPTRLTEHSDSLADGIPDTWYEYVPSSYDGACKVPLVISLHGGLMTGWGQSIYSSWTIVSERDGFIVVFPNAHERRIWVLECEKKTMEILGEPNPGGFYMHTPPKQPEDNHDLKFLLMLIERMKQKYNIDESRIFMHGMSMGEIMSSQFARYYGRILAGQAGSAGVTWPEVLFDEQGEVINRAGSIPIWQSRVEHESIPLHEDETDEFVKRNREYWKKINLIDQFPEIKIVGEDNFAFYQGDHADYVFRDIKNRDHGQTFDDAELIWDYLFSGLQRGKNGEVVNNEPLCQRIGDAYAIALATGSAKAYVNNRIVMMSGPSIMHQKLKYHGLNGEAIVRGEYFLVPISFVATVFEAIYISEEGGRFGELILKDGRTLQFAQGSIGCVVNNRVHSMFCEAVYKDGELYVPIEWICKKVFDNHTSNCEDVLYITDHYAELSLNMALIIRDEILK